MLGESRSDVVMQTSRHVRSLLDGGRLDLPLPGRGRTAQRLVELSEITRTYPVGVGRIVEAHVDAVAILSEAGVEPRPDSLYGVWASAGTPPAVLEGGALYGTKRFCSGLGIVDRALIVVAADDDRMRLVDVDVVQNDTATHDTTAWATPALADTATGDIVFAGREVASTEVIASNDWYLDRPGFWHGACGPAACWAGAVLGVVDAADRLVDDDVHQQAHVGAMRATRWSLRALLEQAGREIDVVPDDRAGAEIRGRSLRHSVERMCSDVLDRFARSFGPRPLTSDPAVARRVADTHLYLRQHHGERELPFIADSQVRQTGGTP